MSLEKLSSQVQRTQALVEENTVLVKFALDGYGEDPGIQGVQPQASPLVGFEGVQPLAFATEGSPKVIPKEESEGRRP